MGQSCWMASLGIQHLFPIQILLIFLRFELLPNFIFECYTPHTLQFLHIFFLLISFLVLTKCQVLNLRVGRLRDHVLHAKGPLVFILLGLFSFISITLYLIVLSNLLIIQRSFALPGHVFVLSLLQAENMTQKTQRRDECIKVLTTSLFFFLIYYCKIYMILSI